MAARIISLDLARRLRISGLRIPIGQDVSYETPEIEQIAVEQNRLFERSDELDRQLFNIDPVYVSPPDDEEE